MDATTRELIVAVERDSGDGKLYSCVRDYPDKGGRWFVVDRQHGRAMDAEVVRSRAKSLAILLGVRYLDDPRWKCVADRLRQCACPICCGAAKGVEPIPDPEPAHLDPRTREPMPTDQAA